ncbi:MAG: serine hydrolase domain-containing protein [Pseudomonadota bacterium]
MKTWLLLGATIAAAAIAQPARKVDAPIMAGPKRTPELIKRLQETTGNTLFWTEAERDARFPNMESVYPGNVVKARGPVRLLPMGAALKIDPATVDGFFTKWNTAGLIVLKDGKIVFEKYARGLTPKGRWTSFSVAKSFSSTLVGAAIRDGKIKSLDDLVTTYIPELGGSGYDGVTVRQLLTMTSGVKWNENYTDPKSDVAMMLSIKTAPGEDATVAYMKRLPRESAPGSKWVYKTGETNLIGVLVQRAVKRPLANYLSDTVFRGAGFEADGFWMVDPNGTEIAGCCLSLRLRDYARMGQFALEGGKGIVPDGWFADATKAHADTGFGPGFGYGYQWWTFPGGLWGGQGIFGQSITVDPRRRVVIAMLSNWPQATAREQSAARFAFVQQLLAASD